MPSIQIIFQLRTIFSVNQEQEHSYTGTNTQQQQFLLMCPIYSMSEEVCNFIFVDLHLKRYHFQETHINFFF